MAYPATIQTLATNKVDATTSATDHPGHHNSLATEINAVEATLGVNPHGASATVAARLDALELLAGVVKAKSSDQSITSQTTLQDITGLDLAISASATERWIVKWWLLIDAANTTMDIKFGMSAPSGAIVRWGGIAAYTTATFTPPGGWGTASTAGTPANLLTVSDVYTTGSPSNGLTGVPLIAMILGGGTAGNVIPRFAQNTSDAGALAVKAGSVIEARKVIA